MSSFTSSCPGACVIVVSFEGATISSVFLHPITAINAVTTNNLIDFFIILSTWLTLAKYLIIKQLFYECNHKAGWILTFFTE